MVSITGSRQSNERVSELLRNLGNNSPWLTRPELVEIVAGKSRLSPRDQRRVSNFTMRVRLLRASEVQKPRHRARQCVRRCRRRSAPRLPRSGAAGRQRSRGTRHSKT